MRGLISRIAAAGAVLVLVAGCQTTPTYKPAAQGQTGYSEQKIDSKRYRVTFTGSSSTKREQVENGLIFRAAEVAQANGFSHFIFASQSTEANTRYRSTFNNWPNSYYWGYWPWFYDWDRRFDSVEARPITKYTAYADVILLTAEQAAKEARAFDAGEVITNLGPVVKPAPR
jgi:hypothetical protein